MLVLLWWLIPIGAAVVATWWVYAIAPSDAQHPDKPKTKRQLQRMAAALSKPAVVRKPAGDPPARAEVVVDITDGASADSSPADTADGDPSKW